MVSDNASSIRTRTQNVKDQSDCKLSFDLFVFILFGYYCSDYIIQNEIPKTKK